MRMEMGNVSKRQRADNNRRPPMGNQRNLFSNDKNSIGYLRWLRLCHIRNRPSYDVWIKVDEKRKTIAKYTKFITIIKIFNNFLSIFSNNGMYNHQNKFGLYKRLECQFDIFRLMKKY